MLPPPLLLPPPLTLSAISLPPERYAHRCNGGSHEKLGDGRGRLQGRAGVGGGGEGAGRVIKKGKNINGKENRCKQRSGKSSGREGGRTGKQGGVPLSFSSHFRCTPVTCLEPFIPFSLISHPLLYSPPPFFSSNHRKGAQVGPEPEFPPPHLSHK